jgi:hypothetical protein
MVKSKDKGKEPASPRDIAREHLVRARLYWYAALVLFGIGLIGLFSLYENFAMGDPQVLFHRPVLLIAIFIPFLPSLFFLALSARNARALNRILFPDSAGNDTLKGNKPAKKQ